MVAGTETIPVLSMDKDSNAGILCKNFSISSIGRILPDRWSSFRDRMPCF